MAKPTNIRFVIIAVSVLMSTILYLDRFCVSFAERYIKEDLGLSEASMAWFSGIFFFSYALGQVPGGWLGDRFGSRLMLAIYILTWSLFTALIGVASGVAMLLAMRLGCGLGQAGAYPAAGSLLSKWVPLATRGIASSLVVLGGRLGAVIAPFLTGILIVAFTPLGTPVDLDARALLKPEKLVSRLAPPEPSALAPTAEGHVWSLLSPDGQTLVRESAGKYRQWEARLAQAVKDKKPASDLDQIRKAEPALSAAEKSELAAALTTVIKEMTVYPTDLAAAEPFSKLKSMELEAMTLLDQRGKRDLTDLEKHRLNRLVLESVFPEVGKVYVRGWRPVLILYGVVGLLVAAVFFFFFRDTPREHPWCNAEERNLIEAGKPVTSEAKEGIPLWRLVSNFSLWLSSISQITTNAAWLFLVTYLARFLLEIHQVPIYQRSIMAMIPPLGGIAGMYLGGWLTDVLTRSLGLRWGRGLPMSLTRFGAATAYVACLFLNDPWLATIAFTFVFFFVDLGVSATWAFCQDVGGKHVGSVLGWGNMWGNFGAFAAPFAYNMVLGNSPGAAEYNTMFLLCAGLFVVSGLAALGIDASKPVMAQHPPVTEA